MLPFVIFVQSVPPIIMIVLFGLLLGLAIYFFYVYKKEKAIFTSEERVLSEYEKILTQAHGRARDVIAAASRKAESLISQASFVNKDATKTIHQKLAEETAQTLSLYQKELSGLQEVTHLTISKTATNVAQLAQEELEGYRETIEKDMQNSFSALNKKREEGMQKVQEEIEEYKKQQLQRIETEIAQKIQDLAQKLLGKSLSLTDHEELIAKALQKAKNEGLLI